MGKCRKAKKPYGNKKRNNSKNNSISLYFPQKTEQVNKQNIIKSFFGITNPKAFITSKAYFGLLGPHPLPFNPLFLKKKNPSPKLLLAFMFFIVRPVLFSILSMF